MLHIVPMLGKCRRVNLHIAYVKNQVSRLKQEIQIQNYVPDSRNCHCISNGRNPSKVECHLKDNIRATKNKC